jgi:hypothetical protein
MVEDKIANLLIKNKSYLIDVISIRIKDCINMLAQSIEEIYDVNETYIFYKRNGFDLAYNKKSVKEMKLLIENLKEAYCKEDIEAINAIQYASLIKALAIVGNKTIDPYEYELILAYCIDKLIQINLTI